MAGTLTFWIGQSSNLSPLFQFTKISGANINLQLNNGGSVSLTVDRSDPITLLMIPTPLTHCVLVYRNGNLVWSGPIWTIDETYSDPTRKVSITAVGWFELLNHRLIRSQPGYALTTSGITITNPGFESAISGWTAIQSTVVRSTAVFDTGAASLLISFSNGGVPFGNLIGTPVGSTGFASPLGSTPVAGRRYKLNFRMRARKAVGTTIGIPTAQITENLIGNPVLGSVEARYVTAQYKTFDSPFAHFPSGNATYKFIDTANFYDYSIEWVSGGGTPILAFTQDVNPSQFLNGDGNSITYWQVYAGNSLQVAGGTVLTTIAGRSGPQIDLWTSGLTGLLDPTKTYRVDFRYQFNSIPTSGVSSVIDTAGSTLGTVDLKVGSQIGVFKTASISFTAPATANQPITFWHQYGFPNNGDFTQGMYIDYAIITETSADTDALMNIDNITLQEYAGDGIYSQLDAGQIAINLLAKANNDGATKILPGAVQTTQPRTRTYQQFSNVGKEIKALSDIESGYDFVVDPLTRQLNIYNRTNATTFPAVAGGQAGGDGGTYVYSADRTSVLRFDYGIGQDNLKSFKKTQDSSSVVNRLNVQGKYALGQASDVASASTYGIFEDLISLPDVIDASTSVLPFYANAEIAFRKNPKIVYNIEMKPGDQENAPQLFIDFNIGDRASLRTGQGILMGGAIVNQTIRIFGVQLTIDDNGNEMLSGIQMSA